MNQILLNGIDLNDLKQIISASIKEELASTVLFMPDQSAGHYLTRQEVSKLLHISLPTLNEWSKQGILQSYRIGNRVLYKKFEIEASMTVVKNLKYKKTSKT
jgi:excisionase family DNA binding protein